MKKTWLLALLFINAISFSFGQADDMIVKNSDKGLYLDHKVTAKENFYSVGRLFNVPAKDIAAFNKLDMNKGLNLGQTIRIPLSTTNFSQTVNEGTPVYYKVGEKDGLSKISAANNKVPVESLRRWNNLNGDNVSFGTKLIVGFIVSGQLPTVKVAEKKEPVTVLVGKTETTEPPPVKINKEVVSEDKPVQKQPVQEKKETVIENKLQDPIANNSEQGYFKTSFDQQIKGVPISKDETVTSGIFKTTSGWQDAKYYALLDGVQSGTIIKVINPSNNKIVYAKVLGGMSGIRQNEGYGIRISNAAASALQITEQDKFIVKVGY